MGMPFVITLYSDDEAVANRAFAAAFARIAALDAMLSDYQVDSELSRLSLTSGGGQAVPVSDDLWNVLEAGQQLAVASDGAFDVTVGPVVKLWRRARRTHQLPPADMLASARQSVGYRHLVLDESARTAKLVEHDMRLDLGGIAVGYALDEALRVLNEHGIKSALLDGSGDILAGDPPPGADGWRISIAPREEQDTSIHRTIRLANQAVTTSGDAWQHVEIDGVRYSHIVDPRTGLGLTDRTSATVVANKCITADSLATAACVLGPTKGLQLAREMDADAFMVRQPAHDVETFSTEGFEALVLPGVIADDRKPAQPDAGP